VQVLRDRGVAPAHAEVECTLIADDGIHRVPAKMRDRLLNEAEVRALGGRRVLNKPIGESM
jgi:hypothetical protein